MCGPQDETRACAGKEYNNFLQNSAAVVSGVQDKQKMRIPGQYMAAYVDETDSSITHVVDFAYWPTTTEYTSSISTTHKTGSRMRTYRACYLSVYDD